MRGSCETGESDDLRAKEGSGPTGPVVLEVHGIGLGVLGALGYVKPKRTCPMGGKSGGQRLARHPSQAARARPWSVAFVAQA